jgi:hypothetical protein
MKITTLFILTLIFGCSPSREPLSKINPVNNKSYTVEYLFEHDGCKVYRFEDRGNNVYFTNCKGETISYPDSTANIRNKTIIKN